MTSALTFGAFGKNPMAKSYAEKAVQSSKVGSKNFVYQNFYDNYQPFPHNSYRQSDAPWKDSMTWQRWRWIFHDFRMFGLWKFFHYHVYIGESWRRKDEKIFVGKDENGNKYWLARRSTGSSSVRIMEAKDPHWFRGQSAHTAPPTWLKWMQQNSAHTPAQIKARGEWGLNSRMGQPLPFNIEYDDFSPLSWGDKYSRDPMWVSAPGLLVNPERRALQESGYSRWLINQGQPQGMPFSGVHDYSDELVEEYYRGQWAFGRVNKGNDHDEWRA